jgi:hypothetical protein
MTQLYPLNTTRIMMDDKGLKELAAREAGAVESVDESTNATTRAYKKRTATINKLCDVIAQGYTREAACGHVGINRTTLWRWMKTDEELSERVEIAGHKQEMKLLESIVRSDDWRAHSWLLERRFSERYGQKAELALDVNKSDGLDQVVAMFEQTNDLIDVEPEE